jgi:hypothetical protein
MGAKCYPQDSLRELGSLGLSDGPASRLLALSCSLSTLQLGMSQSVDNPNHKCYLL